MKKVLSLVLVIAMVLSSMSFAFATTFEDINADNEALTKAASLLNALNIVTGYEDGSFKPEKVVTRAEMAAMLIRAKGYESIANDTPAFTDSQNHWAKGYIALASDLGIINGRGNGIFDPDSTVTYEEAAIMMLRALGYTDESVNNGKSTAFNAANYRTKALTLNLFKDFTLTAMKDGAIRGNIALMLTRNLNNNTVYTNEDGRAVVEKDENDDAVKLLNLTAKKATITVDADDVKDALIDISEYLYQNVDAYVKDDAVVYVDKVNSVIVKGKLSTTTLPTATNVTIGTTSYDLAGAATATDVFFNGDETTYNNVWNVLGGATVTLVLNNATDKDVTAVLAEKETKAEFMTSAYRNNSTLLGTSIALPTKDGKVDLSKVTVTGDVDAIEDIQAKDVVKAYQSYNTTVVKLLVTRDTVDGKVTKANNAGTSVYIDALGEYVSSKVVFNEANNNFNVEGTFYLDENGNVFHFIAKTTTATTDYAMVIDNTNATVYTTVVLEKATIKLLKADGTTKTYKIAKDAYIGDDKDALIVEADGTNNITVSTIIKNFSLNDDGEIENINFETLTPATSTINANNKTFVATDNVVIFNIYNGAYSVITLEQLQAKGDIANTFVEAKTNTSGAYTVIVVDGVEIAKSLPTYALITEQQKVVNADGDTVQELVVYVNGEKITYLTNDTLADQTVTGNIVKLSVGSGIVTGVNAFDKSVMPLTNTTTSSAISSVVGSRFNLNNSWYFMDDDAAVYVVDEDSEFVRVGVLEDVLALNVDVTVYHDGNIVTAIVVKTK